MFLGVFAMAVLDFFTRALCLSWWTSHVLSFSLKRVISLVGDDYKHLWLFHSDGNELYVLAALIVTSLRF